MVKCKTNRRYKILPLPTFVKTRAQGGTTPPASLSEAVLPALDIDRNAALFTPGEDQLSIILENGAQVSRSIS